MPQPPVFYPLGFTPGQFLQSSQPAEQTGSISSMQATLPNPCGPGNLLLATVSTHSTTVIATLSDNTLQTWNPVLVSGGTAYVNASATESLQIFYVPNTKGGIISVTATLSAAVTFVSMGLFEYFGGGTLVGTGVAQGAITAGNIQTLVTMPNVPSITPAFSNNGILLAGIADIGSTGNGVVAGMTNRGNLASAGFRYWMDSNGLLSTSAAAAQNVGGAVTGTSIQCSVLAVAFYMPIIGGIPL